MLTETDSGAWPAAGAAWRRLEKAANALYDGSPMGPATANCAWLKLACEPSVVRRAVACMVVVGSLLIAINHGDALWRGDLTTPRVLRIVLTLLVPYVVSTWSSVSALQAHPSAATGKGQSLGS